MIHIAMIIPTLDEIGGAERQVLMLAKGLSARGWQVSLVVLSGDGSVNVGDTPQDLAQIGIGFVSLQMRKAWIDPRGWNTYLRWASRNKPDIVHAHLPHATWFARWVRLIAPVRVVVDTIHTSDTVGFGRRMGYRIGTWLTNRVTCVSKAVAHAVVSTRMAPENKVTSLPNGVKIPCLPAEQFPGKTRVSSSSANPDPFVWIAVGRMALVKDYPTLLRAFAQLPCRAQLQIAGTGPEQYYVEELAGALGIGLRVHLLGFVENVAPLLASADAFVLSSLWEGMPMGILEAAAASLPIVATDGQGTSEAMSNNHTGLLVPVGDVDALATAMSEIMALPVEERRCMGACGRRFVAAHFDIKIVLDRWEALYNHLLLDDPKAHRWG